MDGEGAQRAVLRFSKAKTTCAPSARTRRECIICIVYVFEYETLGGQFITSDLLFLLLVDLSSKMGLGKVKDLSMEKELIKKLFCIYICPPPTLVG
jgi:hypothetical protein